MTSPVSTIELTKELIAFRSSHAHRDRLWAVVEFVEHYFSGSGLFIERYACNDIPSILVHNGNKTPKVLFSGHLDVIEASESQFTAHSDGERLYGRGALDMKSGVAVMLELMRERGALQTDLALLLTGDEEIGGFNGTKYVLGQGLGAQVAVIPDGGYAPQRIVEKAKGIIWLELSAEGSAAHGSRPWEGVCAIEVLVEAIARVKQLFPVSRSELTAPNRWHATCTVGTIQGGQATNQVATSAHATVDIRYTEAERPEELIKLVQSVLPERAHLQVKASEPMTFVDRSHPLIQPYHELMRREGIAAEYGADHGSSDARFFSARSIPALICQPLGANAHGPNEWVDLASVKLYKRLLGQYLDVVTPGVMA
jgi:succinyl-diaminopimelate desuccinylase